MPLATRQKAMNAATADESTPGSNRTPPVAGAPKTRMFLVHCRGRAVATIARIRPILRGPLADTPSTWMFDAAMSIGGSAPALWWPMGRTGGYGAAGLRTMGLLVQRV